MSPTKDTPEPAADTLRPLRDGIDSAREKAQDAADLAREKARAALGQAKDGLGHAKETLSETYAASREKAAEAYATAREKAKEKAKAAGKSATDGLDGNPMAALGAGIAIGAVIGALLPRTEREKKVLGVVGVRINDVAHEAVDAAKAAGKEKLAELGLSQDKARDAMRALIDGAFAAATSAGVAAADKAREGATKSKPAKKA